MTGSIPYRNIIFIPVFFSFYILFKSMAVPDFLLTQFIGRPISAATSECIDIAARVSYFYKALFFLAFLLISLTKLTTLAKNFIPEEELQLMNGLSLAGFCLLFFRLTGANVNPSVHVIFSLLGMIGIGSLFHKMRRKEGLNYSNTFLFSVLIAVAFFFFQWQIMRISSTGYFLSLPLTLLLVGSAFYLLMTTRYQLNYRLIRTA